jgi:polysaccharide biosynthesis/export protein
MRHTLVFVSGLISALTLSVTSSAIAAPTLSPTRKPLPNLTLPTAAPAISAPTAAATTVLPDYLLGAGDQIEVRVYGYEEYTGALTILPDGSISLPVVGRLTASGKTVDQFTQVVKQRLDPLLVNPVVDVRLLQPRPIMVTVTGEVQRPGPAQLRGLIPTSVGTGTVVNNNVIPTLSNAIAQSGGVTRNADLRNVGLKRLNRNGQYDTQTLNLWDSVQANTPSDVLLRDGDVISIPKATEISSTDQRLLARSTFAPEKVKVRVVGEVKKPGEVELGPQSSLSSAIAIAGGPTDKANLKKVAFVRMQDDGKINQQELNLETLSDAVQVQDGDVLVIPKKKQSKALDAGTAIMSPLGALGNLFFLLFR